MDEVQLEGKSFFNFFDSSQQIVIDSATKSTHKHIIIYISIYSLIIILLSLFAPKSFKIKLKDETILKPKDTFISVVFDSKPLELKNKTVTVYLSAIRKLHHHSKSHTRERFRYGKKHNGLIKKVFGINGSIQYYFHDKPYKTVRINNPNLEIPFLHHHTHSDLVKLAEFGGENSEDIRFDLTVAGNFQCYELLRFFVSVNNVLHSKFVVYFAYFFIAQCLFFIAYIGTTCQRRYEQVFTLVYFVLSLLSNIVLLLHHMNHFLVLVPRVMNLFLQIYMFYMISIVANKQNSLIAFFSILLFCVSFITDIFGSSVLFDSRVNLASGHHVLWHHITIAVSISTIAAMRSTIDDFAAFVIYTTCLSINMFSFWTVFDLTFFFPRFHHFINSEIFSFGMNSVTMSVLFAYHRSFSINSRRDQKSNSVSII